ncbi:hypothetical protein Ddye_013118 [Dipteronia dyeriana]|uniref:Uncharacterized protein n=1 Tax=Dipteronia dyeriana TaxID=168575 RepID=A0AAE0CJB0_9ROSI|nr:hypothetical protein Ddye_013118 [Dipteronia dyeriana]
MKSCCDSAANYHNSGTTVQDQWMYTVRALWIPIADRHNFVRNMISYKDKPKTNRTRGLKQTRPERPKTNTTSDFDPICLKPYTSPLPHAYLCSFNVTQTHRSSYVVTGPVSVNRRRPLFSRSIPLFSQGRFRLCFVPPSSSPDVGSEVDCSGCRKHEKLSQRNRRIATSGDRFLQNLKWRLTAVEEQVSSGGDLEFDGGHNWSSVYFFSF